MLRPLCDVHTHTLFSRHAYSTLEENVRAAAEAGLELLGSTDHFSSMLFTEQDLRDFQFFINQKVWPRTWHGVTLLRGAEADIVDLDGNLFGYAMHQPLGIVGKAYRRALPLSERVFLDLDYVIASVHGTGFAEGASRARVMDMYVRALENPKVLILGHIGRSGLDFEVAPVVRAAAQAGKLIEINAHSPLSRPDRQGVCREVALACAELGCGVAVSSDAHISCDIGRLEGATSLLEEIGFPEELVATRTRAAFLEALRASGVADLPASLEET